jgi:acetyltransferase-like isoleucine patch superfamily enzyme
MSGHQFKDRKNVFIGADVLFDNVIGARTHIGRDVTITSGVKIMNHFLEPAGANQIYSVGDVFLEDGVFLGMNVLIVKPVRIGKNSVVAAGSVVTTDIPANSIAGGIPAMVLRQRIES